MKLIVNPHKVEIDKEEAINEKEINISICKFEFADEITDDYVKEAYFTYNGKSYKKIIVNDVCTFPQEVLVKEGTVELGVVATYTDLISGQITRYNPSPVYFKTDLGSLREAQNSQPITPSEMEQYEQALQDGLSEVNAKLGDIEEALDEVDNLDIDANKVDSITTVTITDKLGDTKTVQILDGINGTDGKDGVDGKDGKDGIDGTNGVDGFSPIANVSKSNGTATITITDKNGTTTATVSDGIDGTNGRDGLDGQDGRDGYVQYTAGTNITIDENNVISASGGGSDVIANPTLAGTENALTGLQVEETKYKVNDTYPTELKLGTGTGTETKIVQTTQYGDPEIATNYAVVTNVGTFWLTALEPNMTGKKLKSFTIKTKNSNRKMTIMGSMVPAGGPYENRNTLSALAVTTNQDPSTQPIVELNTVAGIHKYYLDGSDPNVTIITQSYIDNCPASVGLLKTGDTESFYYNNNMPSNGYGYYWNGTGNTYNERLGLIFEYETEVEVEVPAIKLKLNDNTTLSCNITSTSIGATQWENIVIDFMGDSITEGYPSNVVTKPYCTTLAEKLGSTAKIYGIGGSTIANGSDAMYSRVLNMDLTADLIFIFGGTNDFAIQSRVLGNQFTISNNVRTLNTDTSTFYGGLNQLCLNLLTQFPYSTYVFLTPLHRNNYESQPTELQANSNGLYLDQYVECIKNVAKWFSIPVIDLYGESSLYPLDSTQRSQYFVGSSDGVHPNQEGHDIIAQFIYDKLKSITKK